MSIYTKKVFNKGIADVTVMDNAITQIIASLMNLRSDIVKNGITEEDLINTRVFILNHLKRFEG